MRKRAAAASILSASAVLVIAWQVGAQAHTGTTSVPAGTTGSTTAGSPTGGTAVGGTASGGTASGGTASGGTASSGTASTPAPQASSPSGTFTGAVESTRYGDVQVQVTVSNGTISDVTALHLTDDDGRSVQISNRAAPVLRQEVLDAQSASVQMVSGATYTSEAYLASLQSAIDQAGL